MLTNSTRTKAFAVAPAPAKHTPHKTPVKLLVFALCAVFASSLALGGCVNVTINSDRSDEKLDGEIKESTLSEEEQQKLGEALEKQHQDLVDSVTTAGAEALRSSLDITEDYRDSFVHGEKPATCQKYIMLHDTEGENDAASVIAGWDANGAQVAAHFVVNTDGSIYQCVALNSIAHHAGFGNTGNNEAFSVEDESRDDKAGTVSIGSDYADYGMNSYSIGIELVHVGGSGAYPEQQLAALDGLIAYIDAYYGFESEIIDHKAWRSTNSDTSAEFATYLENYQTSRHH